MTKKMILLVSTPLVGFDDFSIPKQTNHIYMHLVVHKL